MKRTRIVMQALLLGSTLLAFLSPVDAQDATYPVVTDKTWTVKDVNGNILGNAQQVCITATSPSPCPSGATIYAPGTAGAAWASIPGATWIWSPTTAGPGSQPPITGATSPADNAEFVFSRIFFICGTTPTGGTISIAADNSAEVFLNGATTPVVTSPVTTANGQPGWSVVTTATVPASSLISGLNMITIHAKNAPTDCSPDTYACNPAGVILGASFTDALPAVPQCTNPNAPAGSVIQVPIGQGCTEFEICGCFFGNASYVSLGSSCPSTSSTFTIGGTISGLTGTGLVLQDNGGNDLTVSAGATSFTFNGSVSAGSSYNVTVLTQPSFPMQNCTVANGSGTANGNVTNVAITCITPPCGATAAICGAGQLCCLGSSGGPQCVNPVFMTGWCEQFNPTYMDCSVPPSSLCSAFPGTTCQPMPLSGGRCSLDEYTCQAPGASAGCNTSISGGESGAALVTFLALMAVWSIAGLWRLRRRPSR